MNGGYQTLDLHKATAGDPVTIKGSYESVKGSNGKTILVEDKDGQEVFAQSKEVSDDYVITYISAEGKTVKVTITDEDAVTTVIEDDSASIESLNQAVAEINNRVSANYIDDVVNITPSEYASNDYIVPDDGYLKITPVTGRAIGFDLVSTNRGDSTTLISSLDTNGYMLFVKKGMSFRFAISASEVGNVTYFKLG